MDDRKANLVITDPPYNVNYEGSAGKIKNDNMANDAFYNFLLAAFQNTEAVMADDASIYVFHSDTEGLNFRRPFRMPVFICPVAVYGKSNRWCWGVLRISGSMSCALRLEEKRQASVVQWAQGNDHLGVRQTKKEWRPPDNEAYPLLAYPIMNSSMTNTLVLDPFGGSGSTLIACEQTDRSCATIELDEKFCDVIVKRYIELVGAADKVSVQRDGLTYSYAEVAVKSD